MVELPHRHRKLDAIWGSWICMEDGDRAGSAEVAWALLGHSVVSEDGDRAGSAEVAWAKLSLLSSCNFCRSCSVTIFRHEWPSRKQFVNQVSRCFKMFQVQWKDPTSDTVRSISLTSAPPWNVWNVRILGWVELNSEAEWREVTSLSQWILRGLRIWGAQLFGQPVKDMQRSWSNLQHHWTTEHHSRSKSLPNSSKHHPITIWSLAFSCTSEERSAKVCPFSCIFAWKMRWSVATLRISWKHLDRYNPLPFMKQKKKAMKKLRQIDAAEACLCCVDLSELLHGFLLLLQVRLSSSTWLIAHIQLIGVRTKNKKSLISSSIPVISCTSFTRHH